MRFIHRTTQAQIVIRSWAVIAAIMLVSLTGKTAVAHDMTRRASIIDGDTLEIYGTRIRLWGIDAPESSQLSRGDDSLPYRCGAKAANDLDAFIAGRPVSCLPISLDRYGRTVATCAVGGADLGNWLVRSGLALDWPEYSKRKYDAAQRDAEQAGRGLWKGSNVEPWLYRVCIRANGMPAACPTTPALILDHVRSARKRWLRAGRIRSKTDTSHPAPWRSIHEERLFWMASARLLVVLVTESRPNARLLVLTEQLVTSALSVSSRHREQLASDDRHRGVSRFLITERRGA
jgi:endonuclease YncB( thermonuclease family)